MTEPENRNTLVENKQIYRNTGYDTSQQICFWMIVLMIFIGTIAIGCSLKRLVEWAML